VWRPGLVSVDLVADSQACLQARHHWPGGGFQYFCQQPGDLYDAEVWMSPLEFRHGLLGAIV